MNLIHRSQLLEALDYDLHFGSGYKVFQTLAEQGISITLIVLPGEMGEHHPASCTLAVPGRAVSKTGSTAMVALEAAIREWVAV